MDVLVTWTFNGGTETIQDSLTNIFICASKINQSLGLERHEDIFIFYLFKFDVVYRLCSSTLNTLLDAKCMHGNVNVCMLKNDP